jgi:hypothetical protein
MKLIEAKTIRFAKVVETCGRPETVTLWKGEDPAFKTALRQNRILTIIREHGGKSDFGLVGFHKAGNAIQLLFPKPLTAFQDARIIGIKYDLVKLSGPKGRIAKSVPGLKPASRQSSPPTILRDNVPAVVSSTKASIVRTPKLPKRFRVSIRLTAVKEISVEVEARSKKLARELALNRKLVTDFDADSVSMKALSISEI